MVAWIEIFCNGRKASAVVGDYQSPVQNIEQAGILKISLLSPIWNDLYPANLIQDRIIKS